MGGQMPTTNGYSASKGGMYSNGGPVKARQMEFDNMGM